MTKPTDASVRERLLATACDLFYAEGIQAVGVQRVIEEADAAKASLYAHFPSKDDLVAAYLDRLSEQVQHRFEVRIAQASSDPRAKVLAYFDFLREWSCTAGFRGCPFNNARSELPAGDHPANVAIEKHRIWLKGSLHGHVVATGFPRPDQLTEALMVLLDGAMATSQLDHDPAAAGEAAHWAAARLLGVE